MCRSQNGFGVFVYILGIVVIMGITLVSMSYNNRTSTTQTSTQVAGAQLYRQFDIIRNAVLQCQVKYANTTTPAIDTATGMLIQFHPAYPTCSITSAPGDSSFGTSANPCTRGVNPGSPPTPGPLVATLDRLLCPADGSVVFPQNSTDYSIVRVQGFGPWIYHKDSAGVYVEIAASNAQAGTNITAIQQAYEKLQPNEARNPCSGANQATVFSAYIYNAAPAIQTTSSGCATAPGRSNPSGAGPRL